MILLKIALDEGNGTPDDAGTHAFFEWEAFLSG